MLDFRTPAESPYSLFDESELTLFEVGILRQMLLFQDKYNQNYKFSSNGSSINDTLAVLVLVFSNLQSRYDFTCAVFRFQKPSWNPDSFQCGYTFIRGGKSLFLKFTTFTQMDQNKDINTILHFHCSNLHYPS